MIKLKDMLLLENNNEDYSNLNVGDLVILSHTTTNWNKRLDFSDYLAIITSKPMGAKFLYGRFINGNSPTKIKPESIL